MGYFTFILHTHLPYVLHHGKWPHGSDWLSEAVAECYIPILQALDELDPAVARISMDFSPVNLEQLSDPSFAKVFIDYCDEKIAAAEKDYDYFATNNEAHLQPLAEYWRDFYSNTKRLFKDRYNCDIVRGFRELQDKGVLDAMTCGATHGYFPLLLRDSNIRAQLKLAIATHEKHFGKRPRGIWLPECGYRPTYEWKPPVGPQYLREHTEERLGVEELLAEVGLEYFVVDGALTKGGQPVGSYKFFEELHKLYAEYGDSFKVHELLEEDDSRSLAEMYYVRSTTRELPGPMPTIFSRDAMTSALVWSAEMGYPGHPPYLDFHKKHHNSGLRYWAVTGSRVDLSEKKVYDLRTLDQELDKDADHFVNIVRSTLEWHKQERGTEGVVASPFDTELFGHWWFEGPRFLKLVMEKLAKSEVTLTNCAEVVDVDRENRKIIALPEGSWGEGGQHFVWLNKEVAWTWESIYPLEDRFLRTLSMLREAGYLADEAIEENTLNTVITQAARELLLMEASDWQFVISTRGAIDYSTKRFKEHCDRLTRMLDMVDAYMAGDGLTEEDAELLQEALVLDRPFDEIDLNWWL